MQQQQFSYCTLCQKERPRLGANGRFCLACGATEEQFEWWCGMCSNKTPVRAATCGICGNRTMSASDGGVYSEYHSLLEQATKVSFDEIVTLLASERVDEASDVYKKTLLINSTHLTTQERKQLGKLVRERTGATISSPLFPGLMLW